LTSATAPQVIRFDGLQEKAVEEIISRLRAA